MSQENVEIVRRSVEMWNRRDLTTWLATFRSDAEIDWSRARGPLVLPQTVDVARGWIPDVLG